MPIIRDILVKKEFEEVFTSARSPNVLNFEQQQYQSWSEAERESEL